MVTRFSFHLFLVKFGTFEQYPDLYFFSSETITDLWPQIMNSLKVLSQGIWEPWGVHIFTLMASYMGANITAAQTITRNVALLFQVFAVGIQISCLILVGNSIGEGSSYLAKQFYRISSCTSMVVSSIVILLLVFLQDILISMFTKN